ncbi:TRAFAC clade GTPase domain-containing protein [Nostoc sp. 2RC]|uniref:TRAFAC clade GTPase domain-containing protein n=1 Tax=Nostoc sp. 2RC TaxID=2485484 RepID=UPI00162AB458|nr:GTPase domain-containing protein [Nostoc sp. 2RC]MBC1238344.1 GTPase domain-containing protein [Nostoc sp. 2RC]
MRIVEIGHEGVGKTTFMASMYGILHKGIEGFSLRAIHINDHNRLIKLAKNIEQNKYPAPTDQRQEYQFYLQYQGQDFFPFTWADYRGGAIRETQDSEQARLLQKDLQQADGVLVFCDCQALVQKDARRNQIRRMTALMTNALKNIERPIGLAVVLTKADLVDEINEDHLQPFEGLTKAIEVSEYIASMRIPIACGCEPINVPIPLLFVLYVGIYIQANYLGQEIEQHQQMAKYYEQQTHGFGGFVQELWDIVQGNTTYREMSQESLEKAIAKYKELEPLIAPVEALEKYLSLGE